ncbi:MAG: Unknown protein [uncultured Thiotrichaceae bacterium]|uniref:Glycosyltransferase RgtA/B/C/D-like domain-containing protein n=1 Tax=uncultured Thiotrichaceae bacterium TaxID=298394 RepID=A0A6S6TFJ3_9GAMM|nr:MAG: Unknown protein [uncultured Thiotrichaceae bacterium]
MTISNNPAAKDDGLIKQKPYLFIGVVILGVLASVLMRLQLNYNAGHIDEYDYLFVAKQLLAGKTWNTYAYVFGSDLNWYIYGIGDAIAGLTGARFVAGIFGVISIVSFYHFVRVLFKSKEIALVSAAILSFQAAHIFTSKLVTYDVTSFAFMMLALATLMMSIDSEAKKRTMYLGLGIVFFSLSVTSKYTGIVYLPLIALALVFYSFRIAVLFSLGVSAILGLYTWLHFDGLKILYQVQIVGTHGANSTYQNVFKMEMAYLAFPLALWLMAIVYRVIEQRKGTLKDRFFWMFLGLFVLGTPMVAYHLHGQNMISVYKHMLYPLLFMSPVIAWLMWSFMKRFNFGLLSQIIPSALVLGMLVLNYQHVRDMENGYPNVSPIHEEVAKGISTNTTILSEDPYLFRYTAFDDVRQAQIKELTWLDNNLDGKFEDQDVLDALWDAKFDYVFLNDILRPDLNEKIRGYLLDRAYEKVLVVPYDTSKVMNWKTQGNLELYKRKIDPRIPMSEDMIFQ